MAVLVHGGGVTRAASSPGWRSGGPTGIALLRFDLRGHGKAKARQEDLTIAGILADIRASYHSRPVTGRCRSGGPSHRGGH